MKLKNIVIGNKYEIKYDGNNKVAGLWHAYVKGEKVKVLGVQEPEVCAPDHFRIIVISETLQQTVYPVHLRKIK